MTGRLFVVSLPIGNLSDITLRAIDALRGADVIVAEDTRTTGRVLDRHEIRTPFFSSLYEGAEDGRVGSIVELLESGRDVALVSDAGTPLISDPGFPLVRAAIAAGHAVVPVPGPSALLAALVASGLPSDRFVFEGSLPRKLSHRDARLHQLAAEPRTVIAYESSHRILETLDLMARVLPDRQVVVARELTKVHEEFVRGRPAEVLATLASRGEVRGECVLVIAGAAATDEPADPERLGAVLAVARAEGLTPRGLTNLLVTALGIPRNRAYAIAHGREAAAAPDG